MRLILMLSCCIKTKITCRLSPLFVVCGVVDDYKVLVKASAARSIESIDPRSRRFEVRWKIATLASRPRPPVAQPLTGYPDRLRIRLGRYRILYEIDERQNTVTIFAVGYRRP